VMLELFPEGFEERDLPDGVELAAYTNAGGEERLWQVFGPGQSEVVEGGWEHAWRRFHRPVRVGPLWVGPPWEEADPEALPVVIDPGRAFGTGAHPTTRLCLELLLSLPRGSLADIGSGSGVLSIAAARVGFSPVCAFDHDPLAVEATRRNAALNEVEVEAYELDALLTPPPEADVTVANIALAAVEALASRVRSPSYVTSGYLATQHPAANGWETLRRRELDGWAAHLLRRA
jgi:ribosomal protein L11 methyltransferase